MRGAVVVAGYAVSESIRRRVFPVVLVLTASFLALYGFGVYKAYQSVDSSAVESIGEGAFVDQRVLFSATLFGLSIFAVLFLGTVLAIFLTHAVVRGDAERGLLQPLVVRPVGRAALLAGRCGAAVLVCAVYVVAVYALALLITHWITGWWPDRIVAPALELAAAVAVIVVISLFGSIVLSAIANGIAIFMVFGAGLVAGLLGQIGEALDSDSLNTIADVASWVLPFEALYQDALNRITADTVGFTKVALSLGPFGGAQPAGLWLAPYVVAYVAALAAVGLWAFNRKDL
ncbi:MAG TPA: ABC transporter permease subunit [Gaiellaceae bacterium]|nr:ABC transporter permease subunit [Gaiellaceae bacterium]